MSRREHSEELSASVPSFQSTITMHEFCATKFKKCIDLFSLSEPLARFASLQVEDHYFDTLQRHKFIGT